MVAGTRQIAGVTDVEEDALHHKLLIRYDPAITDETAIYTAVSKMVDDLAQLIVPIN